MSNDKLQKLSEARSTTVHRFRFLEACYGHRESLAACGSPIHTPLLREGLVYVKLVCVPVVLSPKSQWLLARGMFVPQLIVEPTSN